MRRAEEPRIICRCDWCREDIHAGERYFRGKDVGNVHGSCLKSVAIDAIRYELSESQIAEMIGVDECVEW